MNRPGSSCRRDEKVRLRDVVNWLSEVDEWVILLLDFTALRARIEASWWRENPC